MDPSTLMRRFNQERQEGFQLGASVAPFTPLVIRIRADLVFNACFFCVFLRAPRGEPRFPGSIQP
jgi:hypothetical protein